MIKIANYWIILVIIIIFINIQPVCAQEVFNPVLNPAAVYCDSLGYQYTIQSDATGDQGICQLPNGQSIDEWQFFLGDAGQDYNYCSLKGYQTESTTDPVITDRYLTSHVSVCVLPDTHRVEVGEIMNMKYDLVGYLDDRKNRPVFDPINDIVTTEGTPIRIVLKASDPNSDPIIFSSAIMPVGATLTHNLFCWTPSMGQAGKYHIPFTVSDGNLEAFQSVNIIVNEPWRNVPTNVKIVPKTINLGSKGYFLAFVTLSEEYKDATIDMKTVSCSGAPAVRMMKMKIFPRTVGFVFKTSELKGVESGRRVILPIKGELKNKGITYTFTGADSVKIISKRTWQPDDIKDVSKVSDDQLFKKYST